MAIHEIIRMGHPTLRQPAQPVPHDALNTAKLESLLDDLRDTLADSGGIGLAAPQINVPLQIVLIDLPGGPSRYGELPAVPATYFINPVVDILDPVTAGYWEGCLSVPGLRGFVERPQKLRVRALTPSGEALEAHFEGFAATVIQHEFDHLNGRLYIDHIADPKLLMFDAEYERFVLNADEPPAA